MSEEENDGVEVQPLIPVEYITLQCGVCSHIVPVMKSGPGPQIAHCYACGSVYQVLIMATLLDKVNITLN